MRLSDSFPQSRARSQWISAELGCVIWATKRKCVRLEKAKRLNNRRSRPGEVAAARKLSGAEVPAGCSSRRRPARVAAPASSSSPRRRVYYARFALVNRSGSPGARVALPTLSFPGAGRRERASARGVTAR